MSSLLSTPEDPVTQYSSPELIPTPIPKTSEEIERANLNRELSKLVNERQKLTTLHRSAENKILNILNRKKKVESSVAEEQSELSEEDWTLKALEGRKKLQEVNERIEEEELQFRMLVEEASSRAHIAKQEAEETFDELLNFEKQLGQKSIKILLPGEKTFKEIEELEEKQRKVEEKLEKVRHNFFGLQLKKMHYEKLIANKLGNDSTNNTKMNESEIVRLVIEIDAHQEEGFNQDLNLHRIDKQMNFYRDRIDKLKRNKINLIEQNEILNSDILKLDQDILKVKECQIINSDKDAKSRKKSEDVFLMNLKTDKKLHQNYQEKLQLKEDLEKRLNELQSKSKDKIQNMRKNAHLKS